jgi:hypothetical protein
MKDSNYTIFRVAAIQRYSRGRQAPVFPRLVSPPIFMCLWVVLALLLTGGLAAWFFRVPIFVLGSATVVHKTNGEIVIVAFFPPEQLPKLRAGQTLFLSSSRGPRFSEAIIAVNPEILSPYVVRQQFAVALDAAHLISGPSAVTLARPQASTFSFSAEAYLGSIFRAEVEVGSQRVIMLLPAIGRLLGG